MHGSISFSLLGFLIFFWSLSSFAIDKVAEGFRVNNSTIKRIDAHGRCRDVNNTSGSDHFVSTKTPAEWYSFLSLTPSGVNSTTACPVISNYTTSVHKTMPTGAIGVSISGVSPAWTNTAWTQVTASTSNAIVLTGIVVNPAANAEFEVDIGKGTAGSETVVATVAGVRNSGAAGPWWIELPIAVDNIASGQRVAVRFRKTGTNTNAWTFKLTYYDKPAGGDVPVTSVAPQVYPTSTSGLSVTPSGTAWVNSSWTQLIASTSTAIVVGGLTIDPGASVTFEADIGVGAPGSEVVVTTLRDDAPNGSGGPYTRILTPALDNIPTGSRVSIRIRHSTTSMAAFTFKLIYYQSPVGVTLNSKPLKWAPSSTNGASITPSSVAWDNSTWVELISSASDHLQLAACQFNPGVATQFELEFGIGPAGSETPIAVMRGHLGNTNLLDFAPPFRPLVDAIPAGARLAVRLRKQSTSTTAWTLSAGYYENTGSSNKQSAYHNSLPPAADGLTIAGAATAWTNSTYTQFSSGLSKPALLTFVAFNPGAAVEFEIDIATGSPGSETVVSTIAGSSLNTNGNQILYLPTPLFIAASTPISLRLRKEATSTANWTLAIGYANLQ